jgi:20S proteasome alpha/beta subunit
VTLVAGFRCHEGIVIVADMEENVGLSGKRAVPKMREVIFATTDPSWRGTFSGAGDGATIEIAIDLLIEKLASVPADNRNIRSVVTDVLAECHDKYIDPVSSSNGMSLVFGIVQNGNPILVSTEKRTPQFPVAFIAQGYGAEMASYFADRLHDYWATLGDTAKLACFISNEVNQAVQYCGLGAEMALLHKDGGWRKFGPSGMANLLKELPDFDATLSEYGQQLKSAKIASLDDVKGKNDYRN